MNRRLVVSVSAAFAILLSAQAATAQEIRLSSPLAATFVTPDGGGEIRHQLAVARMRAEEAMPFQLDPPMKEVRLSSGAKTAIIVTAIVVGALIIVGAVALSRPGKKLP